MAMAVISRKWTMFPAVVLLSFLFRATLVNAAPTISLSGSSGVVADSDEFFTDVWADPKTFEDTCDIGFDLFRYEPETAAGGIWTGVNPAGVGPVVGIVPIPTVGTQLAYREDCGKLGLHVPINANKYSFLSWKARSSYPSSLAVLWSKENNYAIEGLADCDGYFLPSGGAAIPTLPNLWNLYQFDLPARSPASLPWSGWVKGVSIWQSFGLPQGGSTSFDFIRLIDPSSSPSLNLSWVGNSDGQAVAGGEIVSIYADTDNQGYDGLALKRLLAGSGSTSIRSGVLPPGRYYLYSELSTHNYVTPTVLARSSYHGPIDINGKPRLKFISPSRESGPEYSRDERGDAWDMNQATDVVNIVDQYGNPTPPSYRGLHDASFSGGYLQATSDYDPIGFTVDTQVHFAVPSNKPVDTNRYRYFCFRMQVDPQHLVRDGDPVGLNAAGWVSRVIWVRNSGNNGFGSTKALELIERSQTYPDFAGGFSTYCIDLWDEESYESGDKYRDVKLANLIRFDPLEAMPETRFLLDYAALYADNETNANGQFQIRWNVEDPEGEAVDISLYYDSDNQNFDGTLMTSVSGQAVGAGSYLWDASSLASGRYYIYAVVSDGVNTNRYYSDVYVNVGDVSLSGGGGDVPCDYDGDAHSDLVVVRQNADNSATWFMRRSSDGAITAEVYGNRARDLFYGGDFDGDSVTDMCFATSRAPFTEWHNITTAGSTPVMNSQAWGVSGDIPAPGDIDGDDITDRTIFRPTEGTWYSIRSLLSVIVLPWGLYGDMPVLADYDGDGWDDIAVWRPSDGWWWILQSSRGASYAPADVLGRQWGLPGDHPMQGDYDGDGAADLVVWRPSTGYWFVCKSSTDFDCTAPEVVQWGLPGDIPVHGDFDGDGKLDKTVWRPSDGTWYVLNSSNGLPTAAQFGLPGDVPQCPSISTQISRLQ